MLLSYVASNGVSCSESPNHTLLKLANCIQLLFLVVQVEDFDIQQFLAGIVKPFLHKQMDDAFACASSLCFLLPCLVFLFPAFAPHLSKVEQLVETGCFTNDRACFNSTSPHLLLGNTYSLIFNAASNLRIQVCFSVGTRPCFSVAIIINYRGSSVNILNFDRSDQEQLHCIIFGEGIKKDKEWVDRSRFGQVHWQVCKVVY